MTSDNLEEIVEAMNRRVQTLAAEVEALRAERVGLKDEVAALGTISGSRNVRQPGDGLQGLISRRHFLKLAPLAGALAAGMGLLYRAPATRADAPNLINYQGRLTDASGNALTGAYPMTFKLYTVPTGGPALWTETWSATNAVSLIDGQFSVLLGSLASLPSPLPSGDLYLGVAVGSDLEMTPRERLVSVPYALQVPDGSITSRKLARTRYSTVLSQGVPIVGGGWVDLLTQSFTLDVASNVEILAQATLQSNVLAGDNSAGVRLLLNGAATRAYQDGFLTSGVGTGRPLVLIEQLPAGTHTVKLQAVIRYRDGSALADWTYIDILVG